MDANRVLILGADNQPFSVDARYVVTKAEYEKTRDKRSAKAAKKTPSSSPAAAAAAAATSGAPTPKPAEEAIKTPAPKNVRRAPARPTVLDSPSSSESSEEELKSAKYAKVRRLGVKEKRQPTTIGL